MDNLKVYSLPSEYSFQLYKSNSNDDRKWAEIATAAGEFRAVEDGIKIFAKHYLNHANNHLLNERTYFLVNSEGRYIGTATAWFTDCDGENYGSLEWVSIIPEYQGKKLAKPLVSTVLKKIAENNDKCLLYSQTTSWKAINMYADFGFKPYMTLENCEKAWKSLSDICKRNFLDN